MVEEIHKSDSQSSKNLLTFSMSEQAARWIDYLELVGTAYSQLYRQLLNTYLSLPKMLLAESIGEMGTNKIQTRQIFRRSVGEKEEEPQKSLMYFEDFEVGQVFFSDETIITRDDIARFAGLTGDLNKLHIDNEFAQSKGFEGIIAHGLLTLSIALGLWHSLELTNGTIVAFAGLNNVSFKAPVFPGRRLSLRSEVLAKRESKSNPNVGLVTLKMRVLDDTSATSVLEAEPVLLISKRQNEESLA